MFLIIQLSNAIGEEWMIIVNAEYPGNAMSRLQLYKLISLSDDSPYSPVVPYVPKSTKDSEKTISILDSFLKFALDNKDSSLLKYKATNLTRIRKRETKICKFKNSIENVKEAIKKNKYEIGIIPKDPVLEKGIKVCNVE